MHVYLAGPFFTQYQGLVIRNIEALLKECGISHFSPSRDQPQFLADAPEAEKAQMSQDIFERNITEIERATLVLACIDDFDPGTIFELGVAYYKRFHEGTPTVIAYSTQHHGLNIMLAEACDGFLSGYGQIRTYLGGDFSIAQAWRGKRL